jgi:NAD(P)H dehydrogenase (quinone)
MPLLLRERVDVFYSRLQFSTRDRLEYFRCTLHQFGTKQNQSKPRVLILGATGRTGSKVIAEFERINSVQVVYSSRKLNPVEAWRRNGRDAVLLDLDQPETFPDALAGIDRLFLVTGYTVAMVHQSKKIVDAAADAGIKFIVHLGIFGNGRLTYQYATWHEMVERYIEGSGVAWAHLHPKPQTLETWVRANRETVLSAAS